jgi:hypothetical protein
MLLPLAQAAELGLDVELEREGRLGERWHGLAVSVAVSLEKLCSQSRPLARGVSTYRSGSVITPAGRHSNSWHLDFDANATESTVEVGIG